MAQITTRETAGTGATVAGVPLTNAQIDQNFINLNTDLSNAVYTTGNQTIAGTKTFSSTITADGGIYRSTVNGVAYWLQQDGTGRNHWYWGTAGGLSPTFSNAGEDASSLTLHVTTSGAGGSFFHRSADGVGKNAGDPITWTTTIYSDLNTFSWKGNTVYHSGNIPTWNQNTTGTAANVTGTVAIVNGGTGATTNTAARTNLGATTVGSSLFTLTNPTAVTFLRVNADNTVSTLDAATFRTAIGAGTSSTVGTVTSVGGTGTVSGLTLSGTVTASGNLTLGGTLSVTASNFASQTANTVLAAPNGAAGVPTFRALLAADIPTLNQNTTGTAANVTGTVAVANGGTGTTTAQGAINTLAGAVTAAQFLRGNGTNVVMSAIQASDVPTLNQNTTGNAATATTLQTARNINGVSFNGSANITVADSTKLPLAGGTLTGALLTNIGGGATSSTKHIDLVNGTGYDLFMLPRAGSGTYSPLVVSGDAVIGFSAGAVDTGALVLGAWSNAAVGLRLDRLGATALNAFYGATQLQDNVGFVLNGNYVDGRYSHRLRKFDDGGGVPLYIQYTMATAGTWTNLARFGPNTGDQSLFRVFGDSRTDGNLTVIGTVQHAGLTMTAGTAVDQVYSVTDTLTLTTSWQDTTVNAAELATGTYVVQVRADDFAVGGGQYNTYYSGIMSWTALDTNETSSDEIVLHRAGHASNTGNLYLRVLRTATADTADLKLQIAGSTTNTGTSTYQFKFRRLI